MDTEKSYSYWRRSGRRRFKPHTATKLIVTWNWSNLWCGVVPQIEKHLIRVAPAPALGRIIALDDQMTCRAIMTGCMATRRLIATTNVSAGPADSEVNPHAAGFQTLFAAARARGDIPDGAEMQAAFTHDRTAPRLLESPYFAHRAVSVSFRCSVTKASLLCISWRTNQSFRMRT